jgi:hypothetical protein
MEGMGIRNQQGRATYAAYRFCRAIDRMLHAESGSEKMKANRWANAWSTAYFARTIDAAPPMQKFMLNSSSGDAG